MSEPDARSRVRVAALAVLVVGAGLAVHLWLPDSAVSDIAGDALYAIVAFLAVVFIAPRVRPWIAGAIALGWCMAVELFQLTGVPLQVGGLIPPAVLVLGTVFDARDLLVYVVTVALMTGADAAARGIRS
ncbi:DUF2809 domain-containing protein [Microbacterium sp. P03]|uniref:ribosomal maturation YjgA family protein n=1 Tax=Microbacterium sp. P03 TaxID=3366946 RepID=UPI003745DB9D